MATINRFNPEVTNPISVSSEQDNGQKNDSLREYVIDQVAAYCANHSQDLWLHFTQNVVPDILSIEWNNDLHLEFLGYKRLIDTKGMEAAGKIILLHLPELIKNNIGSPE